MQDPIEHPKLAALKVRWQEKCAGRKMPARSDFDTLEFGPWMGHLTVLDVIDGGRDYYFRLHGTNIVTLYGYEMTGKTVSELPNEVGTTILKEYREAVDRRGPVLVARNHALPRKDYTKIIKLILPLSSDGESVDKLLSCAYPVR
jgi:hypothetical protein